MNGIVFVQRARRGSMVSAVRSSVAVNTLMDVTLCPANVSASLAGLDRCAVKVSVLP